MQSTRLSLTERWLQTVIQIQNRKERRRRTKWGRLLLSQIKYSHKMTLRCKAGPKLKEMLANPNMLPRPNRRQLLPIANQHNRTREAVLNSSSSSIAKDTNRPTLSSKVNFSMIQEVEWWCLLSSTMWVASRKRETGSGRTKRESWLLRKSTVCLLMISATTSRIKQTRLKASNRTNCFQAWNQSGLHLADWVRLGGESIILCLLKIRKTIGSSRNRYWMISINLTTLLSISRSFKNRSIRSWSIISTITRDQEERESMIAMPQPYLRIITIQSSRYTLMMELSPATEPLATTAKDLLKILPRAAYLCMRVTVCSKMTSTEARWRIMTT